MQTATQVQAKKAANPRNKIYEPLSWQIPVLNDTSPICLMTGSAGGGKSRTAAEKLHAYMMEYPGARGLIMRKTRETASKSMVKLLQAVAAGVAEYHKGEMMFYYPNGSMVAVGGMKDESQQEAVRSIFEQGGLDFVWMEEANAFTYDDFQEVRARMRGTATWWRQILLTTNPGGAAHWIKKRLIDAKLASVHLSSAIDNPYNPSDYVGILDSLTGLKHDRLVKGLWKSEEGALWNYDIIENNRRTRPDLKEFVEIVVAVDPQATNSEESDETGIIVAGKTREGHVYVLEDLTLKSSPAGWAKQAISAYTRWQADYIVAERNNGGDMVVNTIKTIRSDDDKPIGLNIPVRTVWASRGKQTRAQPVASLYEEGRVHHTKTFHDLENQLTSWVPNSGMDSPDRLDALVWACYKLVIEDKGEVMTDIKMSKAFTDPFG